MGLIRKYLYIDEDSGQAVEGSPVLEYLAAGAPKKRPKDGNEVTVRPEFLYEASNSSSSSAAALPPRVVVFYAPWCPHCQQYAPKYVDLAREVLSVAPGVEFHAVSCVAHLAVCKDQKVKSYPTLKLYRAGSYDEHIVKVPDMTAATALRELGLANQAENDSRDPPTTALMAKSRRHRRERARVAHRNVARVVPFEPHDVAIAWADAALSFEFALKNAIFTENGPLPPQQQTAFRDWLQLLSDSLPKQMDRTHDLIDALLGNFSLAVQGQSQMDQLLRQSHIAEPNHRQLWRTCTYGDHRMGYTCGLWQLFHVMSIGVVHHNRHHEPIIPTRHASETLRNYIEYFFQCDECRTNFLQTYDNCAFDACQRLEDTPSSSERKWREFPLWLWETHNDVNVRLMNERLQRNGESGPTSWEEQQARWPSLMRCPDCWREDGSWEERQVFEHLDRSYWSGVSPPSIISSEQTHEQYNSILMSLNFEFVGVMGALAFLVIWIMISKKWKYNTVGQYKNK